MQDIADFRDLTETFNEFRGCTLPAGCCKNYALGRRRYEPNGRNAI